MAIAIGMGVWWYANGNENHSGDLTADSMAKTGIIPGGPHATLILSSGQSVDLDNIYDEEIKDSDGNKISIQDGLISFSGKNNVSGHSSEDSYNTLVVPRGGEYTLCLSDGTRIWLNSNTTLKFPEKFSNDTRNVTLEGEAYFEVARDTDRKFIVSTSLCEVEVYGTEFNIRSYADETIQHTTLVSGSIGVVLDGKNHLLKPGEQARISNDDKDIEILKVDTALYCSWHKGLFVFEDRRLEDILKQLSDWYDVDFEYSDQKLRNLHFTGDLKRYSDFQEILSLISMTTDLKFDIKGNKVIVSNNTDR